MVRYASLALFIANVFFMAAHLPAATISFIAQANNAAYSQTGATQPAGSSATYFFDGQLYLQNAGDFTAGNVATPSGQPSNGTNSGVNPDMAALSSTVFQYASPSLTAAAYNAEFPTGTYTYTGIDTPSQTVTINQTSPAYATTVPYITDYMALQGMNSASVFTGTWNAFTGALGGTCAGSGTTCSYVFLDIFRNSDGSDVYSNGFLPSTASSANIPANTLAPNTAYTFQLIFSNRQLTSYSSGSAAFAPEFLSDVRTSGTFTTGAATGTPEPSTLGLSLIGIGLALVSRRKMARA